MFDYIGGGLVCAALQMFAAAGVRYAGADFVFISFVSFLMTFCA